MSEWRPIETAPKDDKSILAFIPLPTMSLPENYRVLCLLWDDGGYTTQPGWRTDTPHFMRFEPTHWMPLPDPPVSA